MSSLKRARRMGKWEIPALQNQRIILPVRTEEELEILLPIARGLQEAFRAELIILHVVPVPEGRSFSEATGEAMRIRQQLESVLEKQGLGGTRVRPMVRVARELWDGIWESVVEEQADILILAWPGDGLRETAVGPLDDPRLQDPPCHVILVRPARHIREEGMWRNVERILLPVRGGSQSAWALRVAEAIAESLDAHITLLHVTCEAVAQEEETDFDAFLPALRGLRRVTRTITALGDIPDIILEEAPHYQMIVMGAGQGEEKTQDWMGHILRTVAAGTDITLIVVKEAKPLRKEDIWEETLHTLYEETTARVEYPITVIVDKWFAENTFHSQEFEEIERLVQLKEEQGVTISLGLPALNEEETVGNVIQTVKSALMERFPLLDEIVLIDSGSVDYTREIAASLGIPVYIHQEILPQHGAYHGKGEALWKSLYVLNGDIIAWIDTDIKNIHPRFVYGILGPLLRNPDIKYVKGFYRRPLQQGGKLVAGGGGRVTELTARPLINLFFPELSGLIQPLSGEYAGRREALERLPFFTGYGVETGLLIDMLGKFGLNAIAQVDLLERIHHNQPLPSLSKMAFAIIQVVIRRLEDRHKIRLLEDFNKTMKLIRYKPGQYFLETVEIREHERPPMIKIPEYREKRGLPALTVTPQPQS